MHNIKSLQREEWLDNLHFFLEDCDSLQCFQMMIETQNAWGALAEDFIEHLQEEVGSKVPIISLGCSRYVDNYETVSSYATLTQ